MKVGLYMIVYSFIYANITYGDFVTFDIFNIDQPDI